MFAKITKSGPRQYVQLVEAFRDADGATRHRHVANLGRVEESQAKLDRLIASLSRAAGRPAPSAPEFQRALEVGGPWLLSALWDRLGLSRCLRGLTRADAKLDLPMLTRLMVINRLCDADSKLGVLRVTVRPPPSMRGRLDSARRRSPASSSATGFRCPD